MLRHLKRLLLCLVLGVVTTVAVAWGCAWITLPREETRGYEPGLEGYPSYVLTVYRLERPGLVCFATMGVPAEHGLPKDSKDWPTLEDAAGSWSSWVVPRVLTNDPRLGRGPTIDARGWPWPALWCEYRCDMTAAYDTVHGGFVIPGIELRPRPYMGVPGAFPYWPIWSNLLPDTGIYAGGWWTALFGFGTVRRFVRRRRHRCLRCGYLLTGLPASSPCPECGPKSG